MKTGNQPLTIILSPLESKIADIIGEVLISGDPIVHEVGINQTEMNVPNISMSLDQSSSNRNTVNVNNDCIDTDINVTVPLKQNAPKKKSSRTYTDAFENGPNYGEMVKQQKNLADATVNQAVQMERIASALEERNVIERERNVILEQKYSKKNQQAHSSSNIDYEDVSVIGITDLE